MRNSSFRYCFAVLLFSASLLAGPAGAQLTYDHRKNGNPIGTDTDQQTQKVLKESVETLKQGLRADWVSLFLLWYRTQNSIVSTALNNPTSRDSLMNFLGCDFYTLYRQNDVLWPQQQQAILNHVNKSAQNPVKRFRMLLRAPLGAYNHQTSAFDFTPINAKGFNVVYPEKKGFGVESNCENYTVTPMAPWPNIFQVVFTNPDFIQTLPVPAEKAATLLQERRNDKGEIDRNIYMDIEMDVDDFAATPAHNSDNNNISVQSWIAHVHALRAVAYENEQRNIIVGQWGFQNATAATMFTPLAKTLDKPAPKQLSVTDLPVSNSTQK